MTPPRQVLVVGSMVWAIVGAVALSQVTRVNADARLLVGVASAGLPAAAAAASLLLW